MAGRRWIARGGVASMGWWCLIILAIGGCCGVLAADSAAKEPSAAVARGEEGGCYRPLSDVIWGFLVTLLALTVSLWGSWKHTADDTAKAGIVILVGVCAPLMDLGVIFDGSLRCVSLLWSCHKMEYPNSRIMSCSWLKFLCSSLFPWSKSPVRILASCDIVVYVSKESPLLQKRWLFCKPTVSDESEAMVVGENGARATRNDWFERKQLTKEGIGLLLWKEVFFQAEAKDSKQLPKYDELKYLRANSGFAVIAIAVQAFGYIYAVGFRLAKNLRVSPVEAIGLVLNIILLLKVFSYSTCNPCHRPLVIYMDADWEHELGEFSNDYQETLNLNDSSQVFNPIIFVLHLLFGSLLPRCIAFIIEATNVMVELHINLFIAGGMLASFGLFVLEKHNPVQNTYTLYHVLDFLVTAVAYIWAIVETMLYWRTMHFNVWADLIDLSQIIPFIG